MALRIKTHILLFLASNFNRTSKEPDERVLLALLVDNEQRSLETDLESYVEFRRIRQESNR